MISIIYLFDLEFVLQFSFVIDIFQFHKVFLLQLQF